MHAALLDLLWPTAIVATLAALLAWRLPASERGAARGTLLLYAVALLLAVGAGVATSLDAARAAGMLAETSILLAGITLIRLLGIIAFRLVFPLVGVHPPRILEDLAVIVGYLVWALVRLRYAGVEFSSLVTTSAVITGVIAFSMQDTLGNVLGGLALQAENSIRVGDWIKVGDITGRVVDVRWRSTLIETRNWETVVIPNSTLMKGSFLVLGRREGRPVQWRRWVWFRVAYDQPPGRVLRAVQQALLNAEIPGVARDPAPNVVLMDFDGDGFARYAARYWLTDIERDDPTDSIVRVHVLTALQREGIKLAMPEFVYHNVEEDAEQMRRRRDNELARRMVALRKVDLFKTLTDAELARAAEGLAYAPFAAGDVITHQGADAHWLYLLVSGEAEVLLTQTGGARTALGTIGPGGFFGEMGLMTGEKRSATVVAHTDCECYRLDKTEFAAILHGRPQLAEEITRVLDERRREQAIAKAEGVLAIPDAGKGEELLDRIRHFFGL
jgi:small-conductance mechanosensitive channel